MVELASKKAVVQVVKEKFESAQGVVLTDYRGLDVAEVTELRAKLREAGVEYRVIKNTMTRFAVNEIGIEGLDPYLVGPTAIAFGAEDPVRPAKVLFDFAKEHKNLEIKAGILEGQVIDMDGVKVLADLPSREVLLSQVVRGMQTPLTGFAVVLQANLRKFVYVLDAVRQQKEA